MTNLSIPEVNIEGQAKEDDQAGDSRTAVPPEAPVGGEGEAATVGGGTAGQPVASKSTCRRCWDKAGVFMRDVRTERAIRSSAAVGVLCVLSTAFPWLPVLGLVVVHISLSYFPTMSLGQALGPPVDILWGTIVGCSVVSLLGLVASAGSVASWLTTMVIMLFMEPAFNHKAPMIASLTSVFVVVLIDDVLLNQLDVVLGMPLAENVVWIANQWPTVFWPHILSIMVSLCVMAVAFLAPPWRSSSHLNFKLAAGALRSTAKHMDDLAELIGVSPSWSDEELKSAADKLRAACVESKAALKSLTGLLGAVEREPIIWPLWSRHSSAANWVPLLGQLKTIEQRIIDDTFLVQRFHWWMSMSGQGIQDVPQAALLQRLLIQSAKPFVLLSNNLDELGSFLFVQRREQAPAFDPKHLAHWQQTIGDIQLVQAEYQARHLGLLANIQRDIPDQEHQRQALEMLYFLRRNAPQRGRLLQGLRGSRSSAHSHGSAQHASKRLSRSSGHADDISRPTSRWNELVSAGGPNSKSDAARMSVIFCPYFTDSLVALTVRLVAPGHLVIPLMRAAAIAVDSEGAASGWGGVISNTAGWLFQPCVDLAQGYWNAPTRLRSLRGWWNNGEGRHFLRIWVGLGILYSLSIFSPAYRNALSTGKFAGWQVHAFLITMQENAEGTLKKGILRLAGTALGGAVALPIGVLTPGWQIPALALLEAAICWTVPAPPLTRFKTLIDFDYTFQMIGVVVYIAIVPLLGQPADFQLVAAVVAERMASQCVGIFVAVAVSCLLVPESGYARARKLAGLAVRGAGKVLPPLGDIYFGQLGAPGCQPKAEGCDKEQASQHPPRAQASEVSLEIGTEGDILDILAGDLCVEAEADGSRGAGSGAETLSETQCWSVPGLSSEDVPADDTQKKTQLLRKEIEQCNALMDAAHRATAVANKHGQAWSRWIPRLGRDTEGASAMLAAEEIMSLVHQLVEIIHGTSSIVFGSYAVPHGAAVSESGLGCFLQTPEGRQHAKAFCEGSSNKMKTLGLALEHIGHQFYVERTFCWQKRGERPALEPWLPPPWEEIRGHVCSTDNLDAYVASWLELVGRRSPSSDRDGGDADDETPGGQHWLGLRGYSLADVYRLHVAMFIMADLGRLVQSSLEVDQCS